MDFKRPSEVRRSFAKDSAITKYRVPHEIKGRREKRIHRTNLWPGERLDYEFLESCKQFVCRVKHPTAYYKHKDTEYRVQILPWSRGSYLDIRVYSRGMAKGQSGILIHLDVISALLPEIIAAVRQMENADTREPDQKAQIQVLYDL